MLGNRASCVLSGGVAQLLLEVCGCQFRNAVYFFPTSQQKVQPTFLCAVRRLGFPLVADLEHELTKLAKVLEVSCDDSLADRTVADLLVKIIGVKNL